ncbi:hypothetical protein E3N88_28031 [Mikania micrantha]|uniref:Uncharacterized protein n=1 Tax=Mikania micrantha TaxID=192012 RepID=A0A5N6MZH4_9ASTR|nr:hypothetical protein E3N88_28031 [Mikania micrantha]
MGFIVVVVGDGGGCRTPQQVVAGGDGVLVHQIKSQKCNSLRVEAMETRPDENSTEFGEKDDDTSDITGVDFLSSGAKWVLVSGGGGFWGKRRE